MKRKITRQGNGVDEWSEKGDELLWGHLIKYQFLPDEGNRCNNTRENRDPIT